MRNCRFCLSLLKDSKLYRSLASDSSRLQFSWIYELFGITHDGVAFNHCVNKVKRIVNVNGDIKTKRDQLKDKRD